MVGQGTAIFLAVLAIGGAVALVLALLFIRARQDAAKAASFVPTVAPQSAALVPISHQVWVVVNPIKPDSLSDFQAEVDAICLRRTGSPAQWLETTREDPGTGQAMLALTQSPALVIAAGGDGTVRAVAAGMAHSGVPLGIVPVGTGNLLARNLDIPLDTPMAVEVALGGATVPVDLAWLRTERSATTGDHPPEGTLVRRALSAAAETGHLNAMGINRPVPRSDEYAYTVIGGIGFDGETMANTTADLKARVGWTAYVFTALRSLRIERMKATVTLYSPKGDPGEKPPWARAVPPKVYQAIVDSHTLGFEDEEEAPEVEEEAPTSEAGEDTVITALRARTVLVANCGTLPFTVLAPYAEINDGALDVIAIDTTGGLLGWANLAVKVFGQSVGLRPYNMRKDLGQISFQQCRQVRIDTNRAFDVQVDGDAVGAARRVHARVDEHALQVRVPANSPAAEAEISRSESSAAPR